MYFMSVSCVSRERALIIFVISVDLVLLRIDRRVWRVISLGDKMTQTNQKKNEEMRYIPLPRRRFDHKERCQG